MIMNDHDTCTFGGQRDPVIRASGLNWSRGYTTFFMLNSVEHEILNAHKYKNIKKFGFFKAQISLECYFSRS